MTFVAGIDSASDRVDRYLTQVGIRETADIDRTEIARWLSHVRALSLFLHDTGAETSRAVIFEDHVLLHADWHNRFAALIANLPSDSVGLFARL